MKFMAAIHGVSLDGDNKEKVDFNGSDVDTSSYLGKTQVNYQPPQQQQQQPVGFMKFGDPREYEKMTPEAREELTQKMMASHKTWNQTQGLAVSNETVKKIG